MTHKLALIAATLLATSACGRDIEVAGTYLNQSCGAEGAANQTCERRVTLREDGAFERVLSRSWETPGPSGMGRCTETFRFSGWRWERGEAHDETLDVRLSGNLVTTHEITGCPYESANSPLGAPLPYEDGAARTATLDEITLRLTLNDEPTSYMRQR